MRPDGRDATQLRPPSVEFRTIPKAQGSAEFGLGSARCLACVYGPTNKASRRDVFSEARLEVIYRSSCHRASPQERGIELRIKRYLESMILLHQYPRTVIRIVVHPTSAEDSDVVSSCALNSAVCACLDAGLALRSTCLAVTIGVTPENTLILDPSAKEHCVGLMTLGIENARVAFSQQVGYLSPDRWAEAEHLAMKAAKVLDTFLRLSLAKCLKGI
eukprot:GEMP01082501.1.p1 GENE.GEMP01082501.1~~GEMP01082501.1.p1  ORF type:complete len:225 (+),score=45.01 GEMP01082501.1:26-676(+)